MTLSPEITFNNVTIKYNLYNNRSFSIRNQLISSITGGIIHRDIGRSVVTAVKDATFTLRAGDRVALIGDNGAGKTTLLRAMAGIYHAAKGEITINGTVSTIIDIGAGMDDELSGIKNICRLLLLKGLSISKLDKIVKDIEEFSGLGEYLKLPVRTYSSGMKMRLMFAVATMANPDILLIDEMFSVGDEDFQNKAKVRIEENIKKSKIFVFASHDMNLVKKYCRIVFRMSHGMITKTSVDELNY